MRVSLDGVADVLAKHLKLMEADVTVDQFIAAPRCYLEQFRQPNVFYCEGKPAPAKARGHHRLQQGGVPDRRRGDDHPAD